MKLKISIILAFFMLFQACKKDAKETKEKTRMERVMQAHDDMMPKMSSIGKLISAIKPKIDSTESGQIYKVANDSLVNAYDYMMDWMKGFGEKFDSDEILKGKALTTEKEVLLIDEEEKVTKMKAMMLGSIEYAEGLLEQKN